LPVRRPPRPLFALLLATILLVSGLVASAPADAGSVDDERLFVQLINQTRASAGLPALTVHPELTAQARAWAASMAASDNLAHASNLSSGISAPWTVLGENVGVHGVEDVRQLHAAFVSSPGHYQNLVDPRFRYVGVGVVVTENGKLWTTHRFMATAEPAPSTAPPATPPPSTTPPATPPPVTTPPVTTPPVTTPPSTTPPATAPPRSPTRGVAPDRVATAPRPTPPPTTVPPDGDRGSAPPTTDRATDEAVQAPPAGVAPDEDLLDDGMAPGGTEPGPGRPDLETVEQLLIDLIEAGV
jgi:hypothetical protein